MKDPFWSRGKSGGAETRVLGLRFYGHDEELAPENAPGRRQGEVEMERMKRHRALPGVRKKSWDDDFTLQSVDFKGFDEGTSAERKDSDRRSRNILERRSTSGGLSGQNSGTLRTKGP